MGEAGEKFDINNSVEALKGKRILHAPMEVAGNMERICRHLREVGVEADDVTYFKNWSSSRPNSLCLLDGKSEQEKTRLVKEFASQAIKKYDIFHFHYAMSLFPDLSDLKALREQGKKIIFQFWGSDKRGTGMDILSTGQIPGF